MGILRCIEKKSRTNGKYEIKFLEKELEFRIY
jgi:hypothetical protein